MSSKTATRYFYSGMGTLILGFALYQFVTAGMDDGAVVAGLAGALLLLQGATGAT